MIRRMKTGKPDANETNALDRAITHLLCDCQLKVSIYGTGITKFHRQYVASAMVLASRSRPLNFLRGVRLPALLFGRSNMLSCARWITRFAPKPTPNCGIIGRDRKNDQKPKRKPIRANVRGVDERSKNGRRCTARFSG